MGYWISLPRGRLRRATCGRTSATAACCCSRCRSCSRALLVPALALGAASRWTRRLPLRAVRAAARAGRAAGDDGGVPGGHAAAPRRRTSRTTTSSPVQFLRTTYKAGPLVALGVALLARASARERRARAACAVSSALRCVVACWPLVRGRALDDQLLWERIPSAWARRRRARRRARRGRPRASSCPASCTPTTTGAGRSTRSCPTLADKPVATRNAVGYADLRATDLLWTTRRARPAAARAPGPAATRCWT